MAEIFLKDTQGFSETADTITIQKSALAYSGYTPRSQMTLEEFVLSLLIEMGGIFTQTAQDLDEDRQIVITIPNNLDYSLTGIAPNRYAVWDYGVQFRLPAPTVEFTPLKF